MGKRERARAANYELREDGSYVYTGTYWRMEHPERFPGLMGWSWGLLGVACAAVLGAGMVPASATTGVAYVLLPYAATVVCGALCVAALVAVSREGERLRDHVYQGSMVPLVPRLTVACISALASGLGCLAHGVLAGQLGWPTLLFATLMAGAGLCFGQLAARLRRVSFRKDKR